MPLDGTARRAGAPYEDGPYEDGGAPPYEPDGHRPALLVLRALGLGDLLTAVPALRALRRGFPRHEIVLAAPGRLAEVARATGAVDRLLPTDAPGREVPAALAWQGPPPDVAVDLHGCGPLSHRLLQRLGPDRLWAFGHAELPGLAGPRWRPDEHERERWCRLLRWYGLDADPGELRIPPPPVPSPAPGAVVIHPGADAPARRWPVDRFAAVAASAREAGHPVVVTAGRGEGAQARAVAERAGLPAASVIGGRDDVPFPELCALVARARCVVVGDTGLAHLASALCTPSVVLFGPVAPLLWGPPPDGPHRALWRPSPGDDPLRPGDANGLLPDARLLRITVDEVREAVRDLTADTGPEARGAPARALP
ncbi:glycosyltransferase family 9 protein [Streptomyces sp. NPDC006551]|uniref:glycosyltransferase family 9 protein n=1 Tax=Streptomyces sp. NPDC006551 TaxID=3157178 RepID=UPI0033B39940